MRYLLVMIGMLYPFVMQAEEGGKFDKTLTLEGIVFHIGCENNSSLNQLEITPKGLEIDNSKVVQDVDGTVVNAEIADINKDGSPEIFVYIVSAGSGAYGSLVAYSTNRNKSLSAIYLHPLDEDKKHNAGYMGHDRFRIKGDRLVRSFPIYRDKDPDCCPSGGQRVMEYKLVAGEASWQLKLDKSRDKKSKEERK